jgi:dihydropyrimidine dehydrogenase (NADP+)
VLGAGDTAFDCAASAFRCGADKVTMVFRQGFGQIKAVYEETELARKEQCEFLPFSVTKKVLRSEKTPHVTGLLLAKTKFDEKGHLIETNEMITLECNHVISAFGSELPQELLPSVAPLTFNKSNKFAFDERTMQAKDTPWVFLGGDCVGSTITVEAANDGKTASWHIHEYLQRIKNVNVEITPTKPTKPTTTTTTTTTTTPTMPMMHTAIDDVDISIVMAGTKFKNPFGLASAPPCTSGSMIRRAFEQGWGFAVTKTFCLDKDLITNVSPRIIRGSTSGNLYGPNMSSFMNIELITEKTLAYWMRVITELRRDFPDHPVIASIMAAYTREDWHELVERTLPSNPHMIELNLSCPHGMGERGMGQACGQNPEMVRNICKWVREAVGPTYPFFAKLTPSVTDIRSIAECAMEGGATGVTAINTVSSLQHLDSKGVPWPSVGADRLTTYGGMSGNAVRPMALKAISSIASSFPNFPIMGTGGCDSADATRQMIHAGASVVQICSSIQNEDLSVIQDYISGLKYHLYSLSRPDLREWDDQTPPNAHASHAVLKEKNLPAFGVYELERRKKRKEIGRAPVEIAADKNGRVAQDSEVPSLASEIGKSLAHVSNFTDFDITKQVVAQVDSTTCINCGRCYLACSDSAYQAIHFDEQTHIPDVNDNCTGCAMCLSVCPVINCITMHPREEVFPQSPFKAHRGIEPEGEVVGTLAGQKGLFLIELCGGERVGEEMERWR